VCARTLYIGDLFCSFVEMYKRNFSCAICLFLLLLWICKYVTKAIGCVTSHKHTNIHNFYSVKYYKNVMEQYYRSFIAHKKLMYRMKEYLFKYFLLLL
jgi:hypothetical protein